MKKLYLTLILILISGCVSDYQRIRIPDSEQEKFAFPELPKERSLEWRTLKINGRTYHALDDSNLAILEDNNFSKRHFQTSVLDTFKSYVDGHPIKETMVIRHKSFWLFWVRWWLGCDDDNAYSVTPSCKRFVEPIDYLPPPTPYPKFAKEKIHILEQELKAAKQSEKDIKNMTK